MAFSGIIELLGIKELAEYNTDAFTKEVTDFKYKVNQCAQLYPPQEVGNIFVYNFRDYCYIQSISLKNLITFLRQLQIEILRLTDFNIRCALTEGQLGFEVIKEGGLSDSLDDLITTETVENINQENITYIRNIEYSDTPARLYGIIERFKGIGIFLDQDLIESRISQEFLNKVKKEFCFDNYYLSEAHKFRYEHFIDCCINSTQYSEVFDLESIMQRIPQSAAKQPKFSRYYIPLLINFVISYDLENFTHQDYKKFFEPLLTKIKGIVGHELVLGAILNKFFEPAYLHEFKMDTEPKRLVFEMQKKIAFSKIAYAILNDESKNIQVPREILPYSRKKNIKQRLFELAG
ncbi:hypothetical protein [Pedobacter alluvionis]|uniref:Uncharacterized protein n=1 Tax=Pedobacter alluvionis TaxID=475253 RepID=A0A497Y9D8_9SPHI|nr:hypothetical protein [Pedobacter alluvionis]RLJ80194.1 hypothetical protein BCL90_0941 [Pedobacter alluvionis]TFB31479.1 hypothetical protein E3V97_12855 [Pedobacter alluvionis]